MRRTLRTLGLGIFGAALFYTAPAAADDGAACWYQDLENVDYVTQPPQGGDNDFFTRVDVPPNLLWVLDNSGSMQVLPCAAGSPCNGSGSYSNCGGGFESKNRTFFIDKGYVGYTDDANAYDAFDPDFCNTKGDARDFSNNDGCYTPNYVYNLHDGYKSGSSCQHYSGNVWVPARSSYPTIEQWCGREYSGSTAQTNCILHLKTYGYDPHDKKKNPVFTGDILNFYPPKHVVARKVLKDNIGKSQKVRQALMTFNTHSSRTGDGIPYSGSSRSNKLLSDFAPGCGTFFPVVKSEYDANRQDLMEKIDRVHFQGGTPLGKTLVSACQYVSGSQSRFKDDVMVGPLTGVGLSDSHIPDRSGDADTMCVSCQQNIIAVVTDGLPSGDGAPCRLSLYPDNDSCGSGSERSSNSVLDSVASFCYTEDLRPEAAMPGKQNAVIHTVGFDIDAPILADAAVKGGGQYYKANNAEELRAALTSIVSDVNKRATSFSVASVTTVQTRGVTFAFVPRFRPSAQGIWEGHMYRFKLFAEFTSGCSEQDMQAPFTADKLLRNPNRNDSCDDVYLIDANNDFITETSDGEYVLADTGKPWTDEGWPPRLPLEPAVPVWNAAVELANRDLATDPRKIYTVVDDNDDGILAPDEMLEFSVGNVTKLVDKLGLDDDVCSLLGQRAGKTYSTRTACATDVIRFIRGLDVFDENNNGITNEMRKKPLGDIFHSSPILVTNPVSMSLCDLGQSTQCLATLYSSNTPNGTLAYRDYAEEHAQRDHFLLVGANDGMLHAFHAGEWITGDDPDTTFVESEHLSLGTGRELWAFIPPDLLPKLKRMLSTGGRHELFVDGTPMVRDIWVDSSKNVGQKDASEFRTLAIVGERQGGRSFFALDVTNPDKPGFRWINPPPGDTAGFEAGESWNDYAPGAPPIGPVAVADATGPLTISETSAKEVWAVMLNGGYDPNFVRGRSVSMLNAWTGAPMWHFSAYGAAASDPQSKLFPVASPVAMLDLGEEGALPDDIFDTAIIGDTAGQAWTLRFYEPGQPGSDGLMTNWYGARGFVQFKDDSFAKRSPFFQLPEIALDPGTGMARAYMGSGDRANVRSQNNTQCGVGNLNACDCGLTNLGGCIRKGCSVEVGGKSNEPMTLTRDAKFSNAKWTHAAAATDITGSAFTRDFLGTSNTSDSSLEADYSVKITCGSKTETYQWGLECNPAAPNTDCVRVESKPARQDSLMNVVSTTQNARFYAFNIFGSGARARFDDLAGAKAYDAAALTDSDLYDADDELAFGTSSEGYYIGYPETDERTASGAVVFEGCVFWNTLEADETTGVTACGSKVADIGRTYVADYYTGAPYCSSYPKTNPRFTSRAAIVPPPPPTPVVAVNPITGEVRYGLIAVEPGMVPTNETVGAGDLLGPIHWLEVSPEMHRCRHGDGQCD